MPTTPKPTAPSTISSSAATELSCFIVPQHVLSRILPAVEFFLDAAYKEADENIPPSLLEELNARKRQLWVVWNGAKFVAAALTRIVRTRSGLACQITGCGGVEGEQWISMISKIEDFAARARCRKVYFQGRVGWERKLRGYARVAIVLERELEADGRRRQKDGQHDPTEPN